MACSYHRAQKLQYANEGAEAAKKEAEIRDKKRKKEEEEAWEARRDERISSWRTFKTSAGTPVSATAPAARSSGLQMADAPKKKKKKLNVLG